MDGFEDIAKLAHLRVRQNYLDIEDQGVNYCWDSEVKLHAGDTSTSPIFENDF